MFIRESKTTNKKTGKVYIKHTLVESVRTEKGPRQRVVLTLGTLLLTRSLWKELAFALEAYLNGADELENVSLFELPTELLEEITRQRAVIRHHQNKKSASLKNSQVNDTNTEDKNYQKIDVDSLTVTESRSLGPELLANDTWESLGFDKILGDCGFSKREIALSAAVIWGRLIQPGSDLSTWRWLRNSTSLPDFFDANISSVHKDRIYEITDKLLLHKDKLEEALYERQCEIFNYQKTLFLFDLTNFYFEGKAEANHLAKRGKSKEKRSQNPLVSLALIVDENGFPVKSKVYEGNVGEPKTLKEILQESGLLDDDNKTSLLKPTLAMDRGIATAENLEFIRELGFPFTVIERANKTHEFHDHFVEMEGFETIKDSKGQSIHLKKLENQVLCVSETRAEKEKAMHEKKITNTQKDLDAMLKVIKSGKLKGEDKISERIGKIKAKNIGFSKLFELTIAEDFSEVAYKKKENTDQYCGCYIIEFDKQEGDAETIWRTYTTLTKVENAFRSMKTDLGTRPVYHQKAERTEGHLFLSILAYHMLANIEYRLKENETPAQWQTLRTTLQNHTRNTLQWSDSSDQVWQKKISSRAEPCHLDIYRKLGISNPLNEYIYKAGSSQNVVPKKRTTLGN